MKEPPNDFPRPLLNRSRVVPLTGPFTASLEIAVILFLPSSSPRHREDISIHHVSFYVFRPLLVGNCVPSFLLSCVVSVSLV